MSQDTEVILAELKELLEREGHLLERSAVAFLYSQLCSKLVVARSLRELGKE